MPIFQLGTNDPGPILFGFEVKGESDANIMLTDCDGCLDNGIEICLGSWVNTISSIKRGPGTPHLTETKARHVLELKPRLNF